MRRLAWVLGAMALVGCASGRLEPRTSMPGDSGVVSSRISAARMYQTAEAMVDEGYYADAVRLMRHAILSLPRTAEVDDLRHALVMRMAHVQLMAAETDRDSAYAQDAATMLLAYGDRHQVLFGDDKARQRDDIYELLYAAETFAEAREAPPAAGDEAPAPTMSSRVLTEPVDTHAGEELGETIQRDVRVRREWFYDPDDPRVREQLESWFSGANGYRFMTTPGTAVLSGPRPMVRRTGRLESVALQNVPEPERRALRAVARGVLRSSRPGLRDCYRSAAARGGELETDAVVELTVTPEGQVHDVVVVAGDVVDGLGDACVIEHLAASTLAAEDTPTDAVRVRMPLLFFYDGPQTMSENERTDGAGNYDGPKPVSSPEVDDFAYPSN